MPTTSDVSTGESASKKPPKDLRLEVLTELALILLGIYIIVLTVFERLDLVGLGIPLSFRNPSGALFACFILLGLRTWVNRNRASQEPDSRIDIRPGYWLRGLGTPGLILASCFLFVLFMFHYDGGRLGGDGVINYVYVRSLVIDGDLDLTNEFEEFVPARFQFIAERGRRFGRPPDPSQEPGPALLWAPAFLLTHGLVKVLAWSGSEIPADGYSYPYVNAVSLIGVLWSFLAIVIAYRVSRKYFEPRLAAVSISALWLSSTLYWYTVKAPTMPHATTAVVVSLFLYLWINAREAPSAPRWMAVGLAGGLVLSMQRYNIFYVLAPLITLGGVVWGAVFRKDPTLLRRRLLTAAAVAVSFLLTALPMLLYNFYYSTDRSFFRMGDLGGFTLRYWDDPRIGEFLFSSNHGLFSWTPACYLAVAGLFLLFRKDRGLAATLLLTLGGGVYLLSSTWDWYAGYSFGSRRLTEAFLIFALGFCASTEFLLRRPKVLAAGALGALVVWNFLLTELVSRGEVPEMGTFSFSDAVGRGASHFYQGVGHPAAIPAPWLFAWRYGVSPAQFDLSYGDRRYHNVAIEVGGDNDRYFLGQGWSVAERDPDGRSYRWSLGRQSTWLVPLFGPFDYLLRLTGEASQHPEGWSQPLSIEVNGRRAAGLTLVNGWQTRDVPIPASYWREGLNEIRLVYGWTVDAGLAYGNADPRQIACRLARLELEIVK